MPATGHLHHLGCLSFEPEPSRSGLGELIGEAVREVEPGLVELRVDFPRTRLMRRGADRTEPKEITEVEQPRRRMSLRAFTHFLFERAGFNRWSPAMEGKRNQGVIHKYLMEAADGLLVKGEALGARLYVLEPFSEQRKAEIAQRRRRKLSILNPHGGSQPMAVVLGEFKACEASPAGRRIWIRRMPDAPLLISEQLWWRAVRTFGPLFEARDADSGVGVRLVATTLIRARWEHTYEVDSLSLMLASEQWIPVEGVHEILLIKVLVEQRRRFFKPTSLRRQKQFGLCECAACRCRRRGRADAHLQPIHEQNGRLAKERAVAADSALAWVWSTDCEMPVLPPSSCPWLTATRP